MDVGYLTADLNLEQGSKQNQKGKTEDYNFKENAQQEILEGGNHRKVEYVVNEKGEGRRLDEENLLEQKQDRRRWNKDKKKVEVLYEKGDNIKYEERKLVFERGGKELEEIEAASETILREGNSDKYKEQDYVKEKDRLERQNKKIKIIEPIHEDKWQELCKKYQKVHPFPSNKVFLSIKPEDFIILQQEYQKLVNNSFLLHGFYNYGHMILGKLSEDEEAPVYIGVPGVYYEREKQAAQVFGFAGFESTEQPVQAGSYGYYMIEVEI